MTLSDARSPATDALLAAVGRLWPGARVELVRSRRPDPAATTEFLVLPHSRAPRLLLPVAPRAAGASVLRFSAVAGRAEILARGLASLALRLGGTVLLPERVRVYGDPTAGGDSLADELARALGRRRVLFSLGVGPARVNRKPVLQVFDPDGECLGYAKVGDSDVARTDVRHEAEALQALAGRTFRRFRAPRPVHVGEWLGMVVLVQEVLPVGWGALLRRRTSTPTDAMDELAAAFASPPAPLTTLDWWQRCRERAAASPDPRLRERLLKAMDRMDQFDQLDEHGARTTEVPVGAWHGDWTPWNMAPGRAADRGRTLLVWDWERFETGVPRGLDALHHAVNTTTLARGEETPGVVRDALVEAGASPVPGTASHTVAAAYLVAITARYLEMSAAPAGQLIVPRAEATLTALEEWLGD